MQVWIAFIWLRIGYNGGGCFKHGDDFLGSMQCGKFLDWLKESLRLKHDSAPWS
jgi:hypothetical protein